MCKMAEESNLKDVIIESMNMVVFCKRGRPEKGDVFATLAQNAEQKVLEFAQDYFLSLLNGNYKLVETSYDNPEKVLSDIEKRVCNAQRAFTDFAPDGWNYLTRRVNEARVKEIASKLIELEEQIEYTSLRNAHSSFMFLVGANNLASIMGVDVISAMEESFGKEPNDAEFLKYVNQQLKPIVITKAREMYFYRQQNQSNAYIRGINWLHARILKELEGTKETLDETLEAKVQRAKAKFSKTDIDVLSNETHYELINISYDLSRIFCNRYRRKEKPKGFQSVYFGTYYTHREMNGQFMVESAGLGEWKNVSTTNEEAYIINSRAEDQLYLGKKVFIYHLESPEITRLRQGNRGGTGQGQTIFTGPRKYDGVKIQSEQMARELFAKLEEDYALSTMCELRMLCGSSIFNIPLYVNLRALPSYKPTIMDRLLKRV